MKQQSPKLKKRYLSFTAILYASSICSHRGFAECSSDSDLAKYFVFHAGSGSCRYDSSGSPSNITTCLVGTPAERNAIWWLASSQHITASISDCSSRICSQIASRRVADSLPTYTPGRSLYICLPAHRYCGQADTFSTDTIFYE